jgi:hypothetical protein
MLLSSRFEWRCLSDGRPELFRLIAQVEDFQPARLTMQSCTRTELRLALDRCQPVGVQGLVVGQMMAQVRLGHGIRHRRGP